MTTNRLPAWAFLPLVFLATLPTWGVDTATVKSNKVNVRGQPSLGGEVITQLNQGETVTILEEVTESGAKKGKPTKWAKIMLPAGTPVWVFAPYIDSATKAVSVTRLNLRAGPGENFSVLGRIDRGTVVKELRTEKSWMEIETPTNAVAFVALNYLEKTASPAWIETAATPPAVTSPSTTTPPAEPAPATTPSETVQTEPTMTTVKEPSDTTPPTTTPATPSTAPVETGPTTVPQPETGPITSAPVEMPATAPVEEPPRRIVSREGIVIGSRSVQAPTPYALESRDTHRTINWLHTEQLGLKLKSFAGRKVIVTGEELLDTRWATIPILEVESIQIVP